MPERNEKGTISGRLKLTAPWSDPEEVEPAKCTVTNCGHRRFRHVKDRLGDVYCTVCFHTNRGNAHHDFSAGEVTEVIEE